MTVQKMYYCIIISFLCFFSGCKKKTSNNRTVGEEESYKAESGLIYYVPDTSVILSDDEQLTYGPSAQDSTWLQNKLAWIVLPTQGYPQLSRYANDDGELTLAIHSDDIIESALSLTKINQTGTNSTIKSKQENYQKIHQYRHELIQNQKKLIEIKSEKQTKENLKIRDDLEQKISSLEKTIDKETSQFINPNDPAKNLEISARVEETMFRLKSQISDLEKKQTLDDTQAQKNQKNIALRFFENIKQKYTDSTPTQKFLWAGAFTAVTTVITLAAVLSGDDDDSINPSPQNPDNNEKNPIRITEPTPVDTAQNPPKDPDEDAASDTKTDIPTITQNTSKKVTTETQQTTKKGDKKEETFDSPRSIKISFKDGAKGYLTTRERGKNKGLIDLSFSFILEGSFDATYTGYSLQCSDCFQVKTSP
ncbi:MAG: hypothetical protein AB8C84_04710 [Oligoflexales bacterium]